MNKITEWSFRNKAAIGLLVVMALVMGAFSYFRLPMEFLPAADQPQVMITAIGQGNSAKSMEEQVTNPLEEAVMYTKGKTSVFSTTGDGYSQITVHFDSKTNMKAAKAEIEGSIEGVSLPANVMKPFVLHLDTTMIPISWVTVSFDEGLSQQEKNKKLDKIESEFKNIEGTGQITVSGRASSVVTVTPSKERLEEAGLPVQSLMNVLQGRGASVSLGEKVVDGSAINVHLTAEISDVATLQSLPVTPELKLSDVAKVELSDKQESVNRMNGKDAIMFTIAKSGNANAVAVGKLVEEKIAELNKADSAIEASLLLSSADSVVTSVNSMLREVLLGALFATIVILLFMRNFKATIVTIVSIPLSLAITLYLLQLSGVSLNIITLGGVAVAVGRLVDDSIVVIENIYRRLQRESFSVKLIIDSTKEVALAITSSTIVTVAVFLPMGLLRGSLQAFLLPFALTVTYSLLASLVVALTVVPLLSAVMLKGTKEKEHKGSPRFAAFIAWNLKHKWIPLLLSVLLLVGSVGAYVSMPKGALDSSSAQNANVQLQFPSDTPYEKVLEAGEQLDEYLTKHESVEWVMMTFGNSADNARFGSVSSPTLVSYMVDFKDHVDAEAFLEEVRGQKGQFANADLQADAADLMMGGGSSVIYMDVTGDDASQLAGTADQTMKAVSSIKGVLKVESNQEEKKSVYTYKMKPGEAKGEEVAMQLHSLINPMPIGVIKVDGADTPVMLQPIANPSTEADLKALTVMTESGPKAVSEVAVLEKAEQPSSYYHKDGKTYIRISASVEPKELSVVGTEVNKVIADLKLPEGVNVSVGGASAEQSSDFADIGSTALISIGIVYLIMVLTFKTLRAPLAIMFSLPLAAIGAVVGLLVSGVTPDFTAMFGALMLIGIVVTNAIVLIDRVKQNEKTMSIRDSLIEAATTRMRPIVMTALATVCAMLPLVFGNHESGSIVSQSLAIVVIGGLTAATLLTLIIVPCVYELMFFRKSRKERKSARVVSTAEAASTLEH
ncbi:efflux RND transporter permease subunit [Paenibacillus sp. GCM10027627]|uniref:efflux RND transporter permease subunit n=1 Tax=unclassified Paenibacillus TaxID=185978 RepID=UPI0036325AAA